MHKEIAEKWVSALRSGEYQQGTGALVNHDMGNGDILGHCCLGVLCEIAVKEGAGVEKIGPTERSNRDDYEEYSYYAGVEFDKADALLPASVMAWSGMRTSDGGHETPDGGSGSLASMNDGGASFVEIADFIENHYEEL